MDHSSSADEKSPHVQCIHGMCLDHGPEWENVGERRYDSDPTFFGWKKTYWSIERCCKKLMTMCKRVQTRRCKKCGRTEEGVISYNIARCLCCGRTRHVEQDYKDSSGLS